MALTNLTPADDFNVVETKLDATIDAVNAITDGDTLAMKVVNIGDWNIESNTTTNIAHGLDSTKIVSVMVLIRNDADTQRLPINGNDQGTGDLNGTFEVQGNNIIMWRNTGGQFANSDYNSTSYNRGFVTITYLK